MMSADLIYLHKDLIFISQMLYIFVLVGLAIIAGGQSVDEKMITPVQSGDLSFLRALNNYFGCKVWQNGECVQCSQHFYFNDNQICCEITPQCKKFNRGVGICQECYFGYQIYNGQCVLKNIADTLDKGCKKFVNGLCVECSARWYPSDSGYCEPVSDFCRKWDNITGLCTGCYLGYKLEAGECYLDVVTDIYTVDQYCSEWSGRQCMRCAERAYFGPKGLCIAVSDFCRTWDNYDGFCLTCYKGYNLMNGECVQSPEKNNGPSDIGCKRWDWQNQICLQCSLRWVFDRTGTCMPVSDDCKFYNQKGQCSECYKGYDLVKGQCVFSPKNLEGPTDIGCRIWNWDLRICLECAERWTFNEENLCIPVSDDCKNFNNQTGSCTECYRGYDLIGQKCVISEKNTMEPTDPGCKIWDWEEQVCLQCSYRWYMGEDDICTKVPDVCKDYSKNQCISCYPGYQLKEGTCIVVENDYCQIRQNNVCIECYPGYKIDTKGECTVGNPLCKESDNEGKCLSCFSTYVLYKDLCVPLVKLVNLAKYYATCCPQKLEQLKRQGRII